MKKKRKKGGRREGWLWDEGRQKRKVGDVREQWQSSKMKVCVCTHVPFGSSRERGRQRRSAVTAGVSNRSQEPQRNLAASLVNQWASVSDLIGPGSETDGLFSERIGSCTGRLEGGSGGLWPRLPLSLTVPVFVCVHICARGSCVCRCVSASSAPRSCVRVRERKMQALIWTMASLLFRHVSGDSTDMSGRGQMSEMWLLWMPPPQKSIMV